MKMKDKYENKKQECLLVKDLKSKLTKMEVENTRMKNRIFSSEDENNNLRYMFKKQMSDSYFYSVFKFSQEFTIFLEDLFRCKENLLNINIKDHFLKSSLSGIEMIIKNMLKSFKKFNISRIYPLNALFDHQFHEAISQHVNKEKKDGLIISVIQSGYVIKNRLLKPALVIVSKNA